jgi:preprotein translocase subunit SecB
MSDDLELSKAMRDSARVAAMSDLRDVRLFEATLKFNEFPGEDAPLTWELEMAPTTNHSEGDDFFVLEIEYSVQVEAVADEDDHDEMEPEEKGEDDEPNEIVASVTFKLAGLYSLDLPKGGQGPTTSELDAYAKTMGAMALYPYAREFVQSSVSRMGLPPLTLGTFQLPYPDTIAAPSFPGAGPAAAG